MTDTGACGSFVAKGTILSFSILQPNWVAGGIEGLAHVHFANDSKEVGSGDCIMICHFCVAILDFQMFLGEEYPAAVSNICNISFRFIQLVRKDTSA